MRFSLRQKIVSITIALVLIVSVSCAVFLKTIVHKALENEVDQRAVAIARHFAELSADASLTGSTSLLKTHIRDYIAADSYLAYIVILQNRDDIQAHSFPDTPPPRVMNAILSHSRDVLSIYFIGPDGHKIEDFCIQVGSGYDGAVHIGVRESKIDTEVNALLGRLSPTLFLLVLAGALVAYLLSSIITRHVSVLMSGVSRVSAGDLDVVIDVRSRDEIGECAQAFNIMAEKLRSTMVSREFMEKMINTMNDVLVVISPDGVIQSVNQAFCSLFACESFRLVGHHVGEFGDDTPPALMFAAYRKALEDGRYHGIEVSCRGCHGNPIPMLFSLAVMKDDAGSPHAIICAAQDISEIKRVQDELNQKQIELEGINRNLEGIVASRTAELAIGNESLRAEIAERQKKTEELRAARDLAESANRSKTEFLANMSHEMRTPLNSIIGGTDYLAGAVLTSDQQRCLDMIRHAGDSLLVQVNDLIDLARIEAGQLVLASQEFNLIDLLESVIQLLKLQSESKQLELALRIAPDVPHFVFGDRDRLQQILINLVTNAIKFTDSGGIVTVSAQRGQISEKNTEEICFSVRDTGIGIEADKLDMIFESFAQADSSITRRYGGSGLGLAISKKLVESMGGSLKVESAPGVGSLFTFNALFTPSEQTISPKSEKIDAGIDSVPVMPAADGILRILLVDDSRENRELMKLLLAKQPLIIDEAGNGKDALELFERNSYSLVLMDIQMPVMDGFTATGLLRRLEEQAGRSRTPVIALTAHAYEADIQRCREAGCDDHIAKPFKKATLLQRLALYLHGIDHG